MKALGKSGLALVILVMAVAAFVAALREGGGPSPLSDPAAWSAWASKDPISAFIALGAAIAAGISAWAALAQVSGPQPQPQTDADAKHDDLLEHLAAMEARILGQLAARDTGEVLVDAMSTDHRADAVREVIQGDSEEQAAARLIAEGKIDEGFARLQADAETTDHDAAAKWRRLGDLAYGISVAVALNAYQRAAERDPGDHWTHILLARLHRAAGNLPAARRAAEQALATAKNERDRSVAFNELGDAAKARGNHASARKSFVSSLKYAQSALDRSPNNTSRMHDLSVVHTRFGDLEMADGKLAEARRAYAKGLDIRRKLVDQNPENTAWLRDLSVSHNKLGHVALVEGDLMVARINFLEARRIRKYLWDQDPSNSRLMDDMAISHNNLGELARSEGDLVAAQVAHQQALKIYKKLSDQDSENQEWLSGLSFTLNRLGDVAVQSGDFIVARSAYSSSSDITQRLSNLDPSNSEWRRHAWVSAGQLALYCGGSWKPVRDALAKERAQGRLRKTDEPFLVEAERRAAEEEA